MEKPFFLKTRISADVKQDFESICKALGKQPAVQMRELVESFVDQNRDLPGDRIKVSVYRPDGYDLGAWRVLITLRNPEEAVWHGSSIPFPLPKFNYRRLDSDREYRSIVGSQDEGHFVNYEMGGFFVDGQWRGHLYTNGIAEDENPTPIDKVKCELREHISTFLDRFIDPERRVSGILCKRDLN